MSEQCSLCKFSRIVRIEDDEMRPVTWLLSRLAGKPKPLIHDTSWNARECVRFTPRFFAAYVADVDWCGEFAPVPPDNHGEDKP